jgi:hypothetical protein
MAATNSIPIPIAIAISRAPKPNNSLERTGISAFFPTKCVGPPLRHDVILQKDKFHRSQSLFQYERIHMGARIRIKVGGVEMSAQLSDTDTARDIESALPIKASAQTWGDEIYFTIPVDQKLDDTAAEVVDVGDLAYWPTGKAFCIFFGPTPMSRGQEIRPASAVNLVGRLLGDAVDFKQVDPGDLVLIEKDS